MPYREPYFARYVKSWRKPPKYEAPRVLERKLQHCAACTHSCEYYMCDEYEKEHCPYYNMQ